jgi:ubiquitin C-terminal hydrolase
MDAATRMIGSLIDSSQDLSSEEKKRVRNFLKQRLALRLLSQTEDRQQPTGITNHGSLCYMDAYLHVIYHLPIFRQQIYFVDDCKDQETPTDPKNHLLVKGGIITAKQVEIIMAMARLFEALASGQAVTAEGVYSALYGGKDDIGLQLDSCEFAAKLMEKIGSGGQWRLFSPSVFFTAYKTECLNKKYVSWACEHSYELRVPPHSGGLLKALQQYFKIEQLTFKCGDDIYCEGHRCAYLASLPPVFWIQLNRFSYDREADVVQKDSGYMPFSEELDMAEFVLPQDEVSQCAAKVIAAIDQFVAPGLQDDIVKGAMVGGNISNARYTLQSVVVHEGTADSGHYITYVREPNKSGWWLLNDNSVSPATWDDVVQNSFGDSLVDKEYGGAFFGGTAYMLVYVRTDSEAQVMGL